MSEKKKTHYPVLIYNDVFCITACGRPWYRPRKKIKPDEVDCLGCERTTIFKAKVNNAKNRNKALYD